MSLRNFVSGIGLGALGMYFFDPERGRRRRALVRDQCDSALHSFEDFLDVTVRDLNNRVRGVTMEMAAMWQSGPAPDNVVGERVRAKLGRYVSHPRAIDVEVEEGTVTLRGPILAHEISGLLSAARSVRGVCGVRNELEAHETGEHISSLQGGVPRSGEHLDIMQRSWAPATRLVASTLGMSLMLNCCARGRISSMLYGALGLGLFVRAVTNRETRQWMDPRRSSTTRLGHSAASAGGSQEEASAEQAPSQTKTMQSQQER